MSEEPRDLDSKKRAGALGPLLARIEARLRREGVRFPPALRKKLEDLERRMAEAAAGRGRDVEAGEGPLGEDELKALLLMEDLENTTRLYLEEEGLELLSEHVEGRIQRELRKIRRLLGELRKAVSSARPPLSKKRLLQLRSAVRALEEGDKRIQGLTRERDATAAAERECGRRAGQALREEIDKLRSWALSLRERGRDVPAKRETPAAAAPEPPPPPPAPAQEAGAPAFSDMAALRSKKAEAESAARRLRRELEAERRERAEDAVRSAEEVFGLKGRIIGLEKDLEAAQARTDRAGKDVPGLEEERWARVEEAVDRAEEVFVLKARLRALEEAAARRTPASAPPARDREIESLREDLRGALDTILEKDKQAALKADEIQSLRDRVRLAEGERDRAREEADRTAKDLDLVIEASRTLEKRLEEKGAGEELSEPLKKWAEEKAGLVERLAERERGAAELRAELDKLERARADELARKETERMRQIVGLRSELQRLKWKIEGRDPGGPSDGK